MSTSTPGQLAAWFLGAAPRLRKQSDAEIADELGDAVLAIDGRLGVEVSKGASGAKIEVIFTAFSDPDVFPIVQSIVDTLPILPGWEFIRLKPPRGFAFTLSLGEHQFSAASLKFRPHRSISRGIQLLVSEESFDELPIEDAAEELAWLIVETGVGEELCARVQHIEFAKLVWRERGGVYAIDELGEYLASNELY